VLIFVLLKTFSTLSNIMLSRDLEKCVRIVLSYSFAITVSAWRFSSAFDVSLLPEPVAKRASASVHQREGGLRTDDL